MASVGKHSKMLLFALLFTVVIAQNPGTFFNPPAAVNKQAGFQSNSVYTLGDTQTIEWTTIFSNYLITLWQQVLGQGVALEGPSIFQTQAGAVTQFDWVVQIFQLDLKASNVFFLWLLQNSDPSGTSITSHYFNITSTPSSTTSSNPARSSNTAAPSSTIIPSTTAVTSSTNNSSPTSAHSSGLTTGAKVGIGVGTVFGLSLAAAAGALAMWCVRRERKLRSQP